MSKSQTKNKDNSAAGKYSKAQFLQSKQYKGTEKDILSIVLEPDKRYTHEEARAAIKKFKKKKVM